ncbi:hypothetical protein ACHAWC_000345 [Mediolabrus comicus]
MSTQQTMNMNISNIDNLKWNELRSTVKQYGLSTSGRKLDLQCRLKNYLETQLLQQHQPQEGASAAAKEETKEDTTAAATTSAPATTPVTAAATVEITSEQLRRMEQNRKRALELRQLREQKKLKGASVVASANLITPAATTASVKNPYAKASSSRSTLVIATQTC